MCGQVARENRPLFFKRGRSPKIMRPFSFKKQSPWLSGSLSKPVRPFCFLYKLTMQNIEEFLLRKHCKEGAFVATQFLTHVFDKFSEKKQK